MFFCIIFSFLLLNSINSFFCSVHQHPRHWWVQNKINYIRNCLMGYFRYWGSALFCRLSRWPAWELVLQRRYSSTPSRWLKSVCSRTGRGKEVPSTFAVAREIVRDHGFGFQGLNKGVTATIARNGAFNMIYFGFYHTVKGYLPEYDVN